MSLVQQSGSIVVRFDAREPRVLLVTAKRNRRRWIFPKGNIEPGETAEEAAVRETREEAGVVGKPIGPAGTIEYGLLGFNIRVKYFLTLLQREAGPPEKGRERAWCGYDEALERLSFRSMRRLLRKAWRKLPDAEG
jgi:8-oxo-dGTP pyrophosphatase MutT (NUDIX family)